MEGFGQIMDFKNSSKDTIIKWYLDVVKFSDIENKKNLKLYEENLSSVLYYYLGQEGVKNDEIETLLVLALYLSGKGYHIKDGEKYGEYTIEQYRKWLDYYQKVNLVNTEIEIESRAITKVKDEIVDILKDSNEE